MTGQGHPDSPLELVRRHRCFGGTQAVFRHASAATGTPMEFAIFLPFGEDDPTPRPVLWWLSGLTCSWANFTEKAGAQGHAAAHGLILVCPDTSPRGLSLPGERDAWDFGEAAGFYVDATEAPWAAHYRMFTYVTEELPALVARHFPADPGRQGIFGHSMGGHGALVSALRKPDQYRSLSALAPIVAPAEVPWGSKAFTGYLGSDPAAWQMWDACALLARGARWPSPIFVDQGTDDAFLDPQLRPWRLVETAAAAGVNVDLRMRAGYDHSYYFIATFVAEHIAHHARLLGA